MVQRFTPFLSGGNGNQQVILDLILPDEFRHPAGAEAGLDCGIFNNGFPRNYASDICVLKVILMAVLYHNETGGINT